MNKKKKISIIAICTVLLVFIGVILFRRSYAVVLEEGARVKENSELTYYVDVMYDGKDENLIMSNDTTTAEVRSNYIYVEDKLPDGLTFKSFLGSDDGSIGAVRRKDESKSCSGYVVDGVAGLTYDEATRTVSFKVKNLQAGCKITVGIVTTTPKLAAGQTRMDFYNTAFANEGPFSAKSNTVHAFIGDEEEKLYSVIYQYTGDVPDGAPDLPAAVSYPKDTSVGVLNDITIDGYTFSGWKTTDTTVTNGSFQMPTKTVTFTGSFTKKPTYTVSYAILGNTPDGYLVPKDQKYGEGDTVYIDDLAVNDIINGYRFLGWETSDVTVTDGAFQMPKASVTFTGKFERISYTVSYQFQGDVIPPDADKLLPAAKTYYPGDTVTLEAEPSSTGYRFLGWYSPTTFEMPEENMIIYGEWKKETGTFQPQITAEIMNPQDYYSADEVIQIKVTITNTASFAIKDVMIQNHLQGSKFIESGTDYAVLNDSLVKISNMPASSTSYLYLTYKAGTDTLKSYNSIISLSGALADNNYMLDTSKEYQAENNFNIANISLQVKKVNEENNPLDGSEFSLYSDSAKTDLISTGTNFTRLKPSTTYYLDETKAPSGYVLLGKTLKVDVDEAGAITVDEYQVTNEAGLGVVTIVNKKINILPNTGGVGTLPFVIAGILLIIAGIVGYIYYISKKKR